MQDERLEDWLMTREREICCSCDNGSAFVLIMAEDRYVVKHSSKYGWKCIKEGITVNLVGIFPIPRERDICCSSGQLLFLMAKDRYMIKKI